MMEAGQLAFGRWQIAARIAEGRWSETYRVNRPGEGRGQDHALELFRPGRVPLAAMADIARDAQLATRIDSPFVVPVEGAGWQEDANDPRGGVGAPWIVGALPEGETLRAHLDAMGTLVREKLAIYCDQLGRALAHAASAGLVHRALRPACLHVMTTHDGRPLLKVGGFAAGRALEAAHAFAEDPSLAVYAAPELHVASSRVTFATDVWPLATVAFEALTGVAAATLWGVTSAGEMAARLRAPLPVPSQRAGASANLLPPGFDAWFAQAAALDPTHRHPSADDALTRLRELLEGGGKRATSIGGAVKTFVVGGSTATAEAAAVPGSHAASASPHAPSSVASSQPSPSPSAGAHVPSSRPETRFNVATFRAPVGPEPEHVAAPRPSRALAWLLGAAGIVVLGGGALFVGLRVMGSGGGVLSADAGTDAFSEAAPSGASPVANPWITVAPPPDPKAWLAGIDDPNAPLDVVGERPDQAKKERDHAPERAFQMQEHEVTWSELEPWLAATFEERPSWAGPAGTTALLPATGIPWRQAQAFCKSSFGGGPLADLPDEDEWEYAAAGPDRAAFPWGNKFDRDKIRDLQGDDGQLRAVREDDTDRAPASGILGLFGNAAEWTSEQYHDNLPGEDEAWTLDFKAVRGLPINQTPDESWSAAYRVPVCAKGSCDPAAPHASVAPPVLRFRHLVVPGVPGGELPSFVAQLVKPLRGCFDSDALDAGTRIQGAGFSIAYARANRGAAPVVTVSDAALPAAARACIDKAVRGVGTDAADPDPWWANGAEAFTASFAATWLPRTPPDLSKIGFRCVRPS